MKQSDGGVNMDDVKLLELIEKNSNEGMKQLINQYSGIVYTVIKNRIGSVCGSLEIEDLTADVFSEFYISLKNYNCEKSSIKSYLCAIANHRATDVYNRYARNLGDVSLDDENVWIQIKDEKNVEKDIMSKEQRKEILKEIKALGMPDSTIVFLKFYLGESSKEIAKRLGLTVSNVDTRTHRALKRLKKKFGGGK